MKSMAESTAVWVSHGWARAGSVSSPYPTPIACFQQGADRDCINVVDFELGLWNFYCTWYFKCAVWECAFGSI